MGRDTDFHQAHHDVFGYPVVQNALAGNRSFFLIVERRCVVLEILDQRSSFRPGKENFRFAFVYLPTFRHEIPDCA